MITQAAATGILQQLGYEFSRRQDNIVVYQSVFSESGPIILMFRNGEVPKADFERILTERHGLDESAVAAAIEQSGLS